MTNSDESIVPVVDSMHNSTDKTHVNMESWGLTKREYFAVMALQGLLSKYADQYTYQQITSDAVMSADLLILELNK